MVKDCALWLRACFLRACAQEWQRVQNVRACARVAARTLSERICYLGQFPNAARVFFARMCAGMAARPVCARMCACRCAHTVGAHMLVGTVSKCCALVFCAHVRRKMAGRLVCARMCPCAHIVGAHMLVGIVSKNGFSLLSKPWHHYWIILSLLLPSWCGILHFGGRVQGSAARAFFARMCAGMAARPVRRRAYAASWDSFQTWNPTMGSHCLASFGTIIIESYYYYYITSFVVRDCALWRQLAGICCARVFCAHVRRNGSASARTLLASICIIC